MQGDKFGYSVNFDLHPMAPSCNPGHVRVSKLYVQVSHTAIPLQLSCMSLRHLDAHCCRHGRADPQCAAASSIGTVAVAYVVSKRIR